MHLKLYSERYKWCENKWTTCGTRSRNKPFLWINSARRTDSTMCQKRMPMSFTKWARHLLFNPSSESIKANYSILKISLSYSCQVTKRTWVLWFEILHFMVENSRSVSKHSQSRVSLNTRTKLNFRTIGSIDYSGASVPTLNLFALLRPMELSPLSSVIELSLITANWLRQSRRLKWPIEREASWVSRSTLKLSNWRLKELAKASTQTK